MLIWFVRIKQRPRDFTVYNFCFKCKSVSHRAGTAFIQSEFLTLLLLRVSVSKYFSVLQFFSLVVFRGFFFFENLPHIDWLFLRLPHLFKYIAFIYFICTFTYFPTVKYIMNKRRGPQFPLCGFTLSQPGCVSLMQCCSFHHDLIMISRCVTMYSILCGGDIPSSMNYIYYKRLELICSSSGSEKYPSWEPFSVEAVYLL